MRWIYTGTNTQETLGQWTHHVQSIRPNDSFSTDINDLRSCDVWLADQFNTPIPIPFHPCYQRALLLNSNTEVTQKNGTIIQYNQWDWEELLQKWGSNSEFIPQKGGIIHLEHRSDRKDAMNQNWEQNGKSLAKYEWFDAVKPGEGIPNGTAACRMSHTRLLEKWLTESEQDDEWFLVLEDDAHWISEHSMWPEEHPPVDTAIAYLGCAVYHWFEDKANKTHWQRVSAWYGHAYAVQRKFLPRILEIIHAAPADWSIDMIYCHAVSRELRTMAWVPNVLTQAAGASDIEGAVIDRTPKVLALENILKPVHFIHHFPIQTSMQELAEMNHDWMLLTHPNVDPNFWQLDSSIPADWDILVFGNDTQEENWHRTQYKPGSRAVAIKHSVLKHWQEEGVLTQIPQQWEEWLQENSKTINTYAPGNQNPWLRTRTKWENLPTVSIVTPTFGGRNWFWSALYCFLRQDYPQDKLEWIILDEGDKSIQKWIPPQESRIRYYHLNADDRKMIYRGMVQKLSTKARKPNMDEVRVGKAVAVNKNLPFRKAQRKRPKEMKPEELPESMLMTYHRGGDFWKERLPIGFKRNWLASQAKHDIVLHWDDDDWYPTQSIRQRVEMLLESGNDIATCTTIPCFDVTRCISWMNVPPQKDPFGKRVSEATMVYWKRAWEKQHFDSQVIGEEGESFVAGREKDVYEMPWKDVIVSLVHRGNLSSRRSPGASEPNGWHFGNMDESEFMMLTALDDPDFSKTSGLQIHVQRLIERFLI